MQTEPGRIESGKMRVRQLAVIAAASLILCGCGQTYFGHSSAAATNSAAPVSTSASLTGTCTPGMYDADTQVFYSLNQAVPNDSIIYYGYQVSFTDKSQASAHVTGWAVAFYDKGGSEISSADDTNADGFITSGQSQTWTVWPWNNNNGQQSNAPFAAGQSGAVDPTVTCSVIQWYNGYGS